jgi:hypothetical protein
MIQMLYSNLLFLVQFVLVENLIFYYVLVLPIDWWYFFYFVGVHGGSWL